MQSFMQLGLLFLIPVANYLAILLLATFRSRAPVADAPPRDDFSERFAILAVGVVVVLGAGLIGLLTEGLAYYGVGLFLCVPFLIGAGSSYFFNRRVRLSFLESMGLTSSASRPPAATASDAIRFVSVTAIDHASEACSTAPFAARSRCFN